MKKFRFLDWKVYKDAQTLFTLILKIHKKLPMEYKYSLGSQILRSCSSVILNIAEGSGKTSDKELNRFFEIALGSLYETLANSDILKKNKLISGDDFLEVLTIVSVICDQLGGFKRKIRLDSGC
jgi:four helix bundle protein